MKLANTEVTIEGTRVEEIKKDVEAKKMTKGAAIREMFAGGMETKEIANALGIRYNHAYNVIKNECLIHGLEVEVERRGGENSKKQQIITMLEEGKSITEVSKELKCMYNYVWQVGKAAGLTGQKKQTKKTVKTVVEKASEVEKKAKKDAPKVKASKKVQKKAVATA